MRVKYEKYWENVDNMNMLIYVAVVLDPQYKLAFLEFALEDMYAEKTDVGANMKIKVKSTISELFEEYKKIVQPQSAELNLRTQMPEEVDLVSQKKRKYCAARS